MNKDWDPIVLCIKCESCGDQHYITVNKKDWENFLNGELIQRAFPYLNVANRELILSKICGKCFNELCNEEN